MILVDTDRASLLKNNAYNHNCQLCTSATQAFSAQSRFVDQDRYLTATPEKPWSQFSPRTWALIGTKLFRVLYGLVTPKISVNPEAMSSHLGT